MWYLKIGSNYFSPNWNTRQVLH